MRTSTAVLDIWRRRCRPIHPRRGSSSRPKLSAKVRALLFSFLCVGSYHGTPRTGAARITAMVRAPLLAPALLGSHNFFLCRFSSPRASSIILPSFLVFPSNRPNDALWPFPGGCRSFSTSRRSARPSSPAPLLTMPSSPPSSPPYSSLRR